MSVIAAVDNESGSEAIIETAWEIADGLGKELVVFHCATARGDVDEARNEVESLVESAIGDAEKATISVDQGDPEVEIVDASEDRGADYIVMGSRKRSPLGKVLLGSVSQLVMHNSDVPVVCVTQEK
ncbi:MAG: universal stress protein [Halodesulfurarchaeum sp.]